jgi:hypothetical protein
MRAQEPTADVVLLWCLGGILAIAGTFFGIFYSMMRPTVVPNAAYQSTIGETISAAYIRAPVSGAVEDREQIAVETAELENRELQLSPVTAFASVPPLAPAPKAAQTAQVKAKPKPKPKPRRVIREQVQHPTAGYPWFASSGGQTRSSPFFW